VAPQFAVFRHPQPGRDVHPLLVCLQSALAESMDSVVVAPLTPAYTLAVNSRRLLPEVVFAGERYRVLIPQMAAVLPRILREQVGDLGAYRGDLLAAIDLLFTGI